MKLIKFDTIYPAGYLHKKIDENIDSIRKLSFLEFHNWLIDLRMNQSDYYTFHLRNEGWEADEFFNGIDLYLEKCAKHYFGPYYKLRKTFHRFRNMISHISVPFAEVVIKKHIATQKPDVIFIREQFMIRSRFWEQFSNQCLLVSRMDCGIPRDWSPLSFDLIYSNIPAFINFFKKNNVPVLSNSNGFDTRIFEQLKESERKLDVSFVGGLGSYYGFEGKSAFFENLIRIAAGKFSFKWWGFKTGDEFDKKYPELAAAYQGETGGIEMFRIYATSKIVLNDYGSGVDGAAVNMRIYETLGVGSFLLTRNNTAFDSWKDFMDTFENVEDCISKILFYLKNDNLREDMASKGQEFVNVNFNYANLIPLLSNELKQHYLKKFNHLPE